MLQQGGRGWLVLVLVFAAPGLSWADAGLDDYNVAVGLYKQSRWKTASDQFKAFLTKYPSHEKAGMARLYLGLTLVNREDYKGAREELRRFAKENSANTNLAQARYRVGECSYLLDDLVAAKTELDAYIKDYPKDPFRDHALPYLADAQLRTNDFAAALATFSLSIEEHPEGPLADDARFGRGRALEALKKGAEAKAAFVELATKKGSARAPDAQFHLGAIAFDKNQFKESADAYLDLVKRFPEHRLVPSAQLNAGFALNRSGQYAEAVTQFEAAAAEKTQRVTAGYWQGLSLKSLGKHAQAADVLKGTAAIAGEAPLLESILFQQALCERQIGKVTEARQLFESVLGKWPTGEFGDDSLHALAELTVDGGELTEAERYLTKFAKDYPNSGLKLHADLLSGRLELARAAVELREQKPAAEVATRYETASRRFDLVLRDSMIPRTKNQARYYLAFVRQLQSQHKQALELIDPLVQQVIADGAKSEFGDALVLQADSLQMEKRYEEGDKAASTYATLFPQGRHLPRSLFIQSLAAERKGDTARVDSLLERFSKEFASHQLRSLTVQQLADLADEQKNWSRAETLNQQLIPLTAGTDNQPYAIRGLAWAQFQQKKMTESAETYSRILKDFANHRLAPECAYYRGEALRESGKTAEAIAGFDALLKQVTPDKPADAGAENNSPWIFSFRAGLQSARLHRAAKKTDEADAAYEALLKRFPKAENLDKLLDEWAVMNYQAERFERADELFKRLLAETPNSDLADDARLNLAESDLFAERIDAAKKSFEELLASPKSSPEVREQSLFQLLVLAVEQLRWKDVSTLADQLTKEFPNSSRRGYAVYSLAEAIHAGTKPTDADLEREKTLLNSLVEQKDRPETVAQPWYDRVWVLLAELAYRQKNYEELERVVADLKERAPKSKFLYQAEEVLGRGFKQQAPPKFAEAIKAFERVIADPNGHRTETSAKSQFLIGETLFLQEKWEEAFLAYQKVVSNYDFPEWQAASLLQSGKCDEKQQQWKEAAETYKALIQKFPQSEHVKTAKERLDEIAKIKK